MNYTLGCIPSKPDIRDYITTAIIPQDTILESEFSWLDKDNIIIDQLNLGSCVGCASAGIKNVHETAEGDFVQGGYSPLFIYTLCKQNDGIPDQEGTYPRVAMKVMQDYGALPEIDLPYSSYFINNKLPVITQAMLDKAKPFTIKTYAQIPLEINAIKQAIKISPVMGAVLVTTDFVNAKDGFVGTPNGYILSGHAIKWIGWSDSLTHTFANGRTCKGFIIFKNSWGDWGNNSLGYIAYDDINFALDDGQGMPFIYEAWSCVDNIITPPKPIPIQKYYKVQVGAFGVKANCQRFIEKLKLAGFSTYMPPIGSDSLYRVQVGAFINKNNAYALRDKLIQAGFSGAFVVYK